PCNDTTAIVCLRCADRLCGAIDPDNLSSTQLLANQFNSMSIAATDLKYLFLRPHRQNFNGPFYAFWFFGGHNTFSLCEVGPYDIQRPAWPACCGPVPGSTG